MSPRRLSRGIRAAPAGGFHPVALRAPSCKPPAEAYSPTLLRPLTQRFSVRGDIYADTGGHGNSRRPPLPRDEALRAIRQHGRAAWKRTVGYRRRSLAETAIFRIKTFFGRRLSARLFDHQATETFIRCLAMNRMTHLGMPHSYRVVAA